MIDSLKVFYTQGDMDISLSVPTDDNNLPYNLADVFAKIISDSSANEQVVIEQLINEFGYPEKGGGE